MISYFGMFLIIGIALILGVMLNGLSGIIGPKRPTAEKYMAYESGMDPVGTAQERFSVKFYMIAMLFILFDIEVVFMYPWAVQYKELLKFGWFPFLEMLTFIVILFVGYIYVYKKGGLDWD